MANVARPGARGAPLVTDKTAFLPGMPRGTIPFGQWQSGFPQPVVAPSPLVAGPSTPVAKPSTPKVGTSFAGSQGILTLGNDFFEKIHILPRTKIEFGTIITLETDEYEVYNAYRDTDQTLTVITNNASPGVETPDVTPPLVVPRQTSILDPTTTDNSGGTGLGTLVKTPVEAQPIGLASFDDDILFTFGSGDSVSLLVSGNRVVLFPFQYEAPLIETLVWLTDIIESLNGKEQRIAVRKNPRQQFLTEYRLTGNERQRGQVLLMDWMANTFGLPLWHEDIELTSAVSVSGTIYPVSGADTVDFRLGGLALVITDNNVFDVINIVGLTPTQITAGDPSLNAYPAGTTIMPLRVARIRDVIQANRAKVNLETFRVSWEVTDNDTGVLAGDTSAFSTYNGRVLLDDCNASNGQLSQRYLRRLFIIDNQSGLVRVVSPWDRFKRVSQKGFSAANRTEILQLRQLLIALDGKRTSFYLPTFFDDLEAKADIVSGAATLDIVNIEYTRFAASRDPKNIAKITFTDGTSLIRGIVSASKIDATTERLTLDNTWPSSRPVADFERIEFYELVRFDADRARLEYPRGGRVELVLPVKAVFDDI